MEPSDETSKRPRIRALDWFRLLATVQMVQGHSIDAVLSDSLRQGTLFSLWTQVRGLTAVAFLFAAGVSFYLATLGSVSERAPDGLTADADRRRLLQRRARRGALLIGIGYLLHFPLRALWGPLAPALTEFAMVDVLQCIGVCLLCLTLLTYLLRRTGHVVLASGAIALLMLALSPVMNEVTPGGPAMPLSNYLSHRAGSIFPLFPWAAHLFLGVVVAHFAFHRRFASQSWQGMLAFGAVLLSCSYGLSLSATVSGHLGRVGWVILVFGTMVGILDRPGRVKQVRAAPEMVRWLGRETLIIYVVHILVLYAAGGGLSAVLGHRASWGQGLSLAIVVMLGSAGAAYLYRHSPWSGRLAQPGQAR